MKILYLTTWDFKNEAADGVCKKIKSQIAVFEKWGHIVDFVFIDDNEIIFKENGIEKKIGNVGEIKKTPAYMKMYQYLKDKKYDWVYNRYGMMDTFYYRLLKKLHHNGTKILIEIPTYPYVGEQPKDILHWFMFQWDKIYVPKLKKIVNRIVTYSRDEMIFGIQTLCIMNGIDMGEIEMISPKSVKDDTIDLLMVALMQPYHGYERLLYGMKQYYQNGGKRKILCHFVGDGPEKCVYEKIVSENQLEEYVMFYGQLGGKELDQIYNKADIGICTLGAYKKGLFWSSELKVREYLAKGLPFVLGVEGDITDLIAHDFYIEFPNDASFIDIEEIVSFYDRVYKQNNIYQIIRSQAEKYISMEAAMKPVLRCFQR